MAKGASVVTVAVSAASAAGVAGLTGAAVNGAKRGNTPFSILCIPDCAMPQDRSVSFPTPPDFSATPVPVQRVSRETQPISSPYDLRRPSDVEACSATSFKLLGTEVSNTLVPYKFRALIARYKSNSSRMYHVGLLIEADLKVKGDSWRFAFLERWSDGLRLRFCQTSDVARGHLKTTLNGWQFKDMTETGEFDSSACASDLASFFEKETARRFKIPHDEAEFMKLLKSDLSLTNCTYFAIRAGSSCFGGGETFEKNLLSRLREQETRTSA